MEHPFFIRPAHLRDREAIDRLLERSYPELLPQDYDGAVLDAALPIITTAQDALLTSGTYFIAECAETDDVVGAGGWTDFSPVRGVGEARQGHVRHVATRADWLRRGVAKALINVTLASAEAHGMSRLSCMSTHTARAFYRAMGFAEQGEVELTLAPGVHFPAVQMQMALT
ncbi:acetyltransferase (GNAT) family protein [Shimia isoporae]|uniref:Acetyltransferase (GNAT) family protein n=1 Tax=Shimia isoporae TaxID=647720 RepID=A0A4R1N0L6_9RHOB|nr:GNAT family N-acetyltransferase [Shimia isoporae]TCK99407.1 acetyltransferase (GNAT) family protein [Shimia isoporae]